MPDQDAANLAMEHAAAEWLMPLNLLPNELLLLIWTDLRHTMFWRYTLAKAFIRDLITRADDALVTNVKLFEVASWKRGHAPVIEKSITSPYVRLTMDSLGLQKIERLADVPAKSPLRSETHAHVVDSVLRLGQISICFKV